MFTTKKRSLITVTFMLSSVFVLLFVCSHLNANSSGDAGTTNLGKAAWANVKTAQMIRTITDKNKQSTVLTVYFKAPNKMHSESSDGRLQIRNETSNVIYYAKTHKYGKETFAPGKAPVFDPKKSFSGDYMLKQWEMSGATVTINSEVEGKFKDKACLVLDADISAIKNETGAVKIGPQHFTMYLEPNTRLLLCSEGVMYDPNTNEKVSTDIRVINYEIKLNDDLFKFQPPSDAKETSVDDAHKSDTPN